MLWDPNPQELWDNMCCFKFVVIWYTAEKTNTEIIAWREKNLLLFDDWADTYIGSRGWYKAIFGLFPLVEISLEESSSLVSGGGWRWEATFSLFSLPLFSSWPSPSQWSLDSQLPSPWALIGAGLCREGSSLCYLPTGRSKGKGAHLVWPQGEAAAR